MNYSTTVCLPFALALLLLTESCALMGNNWIGKLGVPEGATSTLIAERTFDTLHSSGHFITTDEGRKLFVISKMNDSHLRISQLDNEFEMVDSLTIEPTRKLISFKVEQVPNNRIVIIGMSEVVMGEDRSLGRIDVMLVGLDSLQLIRQQEFPADTEKKYGHREFFTTALSPSGSHLLIAESDYFNALNAKVRDVRFRTNDLSQVDVIETEYPYGIGRQPVLSPIFLNETDVARLRVTSNKRSTQLILTVNGDTTGSSPLILPREIADEFVYPTSSVADIGPDGTVFVALTMQDEENHTKGLVLLSINPETRAIATVSIKEYPAPTVRRILDRKELNQLVPIDIVAAVDGTISVVMEQHALWEKSYRYPTGHSHVSSRLTQYGYAQLPIDADEVFISTGALLVATLHPADGEWTHQVLSDNNERFPTHNSQAINGWYDFPERRWTSTFTMQQANMSLTDSSMRLLYHDERMLMRGEAAFAPSIPVVTEKLFSIYSLTHVVHAQTVWINDSTIVFLVRSKLPDKGFSIHKLGLQPMGSVKEEADASE